MKRTIYTILITTLIIGLGMIVADLLTKESYGFRIPSGYKIEIIDLSDHARSDELIFTIELDVPSTLSFFIQANDHSEKIIKVKGDSKILGRNNNELIFSVRNYTGNESISSTNILNKGKYTVYLSSERVDGKLAIGYKETPKNLSEFERLGKIDSGDLNNPPKGYSQVYSADLSNLSYEGEVAYTLSLAKSERVGISVYTSSKQGNVSVDFVGNSVNYYGLVYSENKICDQLELVLSPGDYEFKVNCDDADGQIYIFVKQ